MTSECNTKRREPLWTTPVGGYGIIFVTKLKFWLDKRT